MLLPCNEYQFGAWCVHMFADLWGQSESTANLASTDKCLESGFMSPLWRERSLWCVKGWQVFLLPPGLPNGPCSFSISRQGNCILSWAKVPPCGRKVTFLLSNSAWSPPLPWLDQNRSKQLWQTSHLGSLGDIKINSFFPGTPYLNQSGSNPPPEIAEA